MSYTAESISVLKGLEPVRHRPGMYTRTDCPLHIIQEAIDNACDELPDAADDSVDLGSVQTWFDDADGDGSGAGDGVQVCAPPEGTVNSTVPPTRPRTRSARSATAS